jgi:hypothetical protein
MTSTKLVASGFMNDIQSFTKPGKVFFSVNVVYLTGQKNSKGQYDRQYMNCLVDKSLSDDFHTIVSESATGVDGNMLHTFSGVRLDFTIKMPFFSIYTKEGKNYLNSKGILINYSRG